MRTYGKLTRCDVHFMHSYVPLISGFSVLCTIGSPDNLFHAYLRTIDVSYPLIAAFDHAFDVSYLFSSCILSCIGIVASNIMCILSCMKTRGDELQFFPGARGSRTFRQTAGRHDHPLGRLTCKQKYGQLRRRMTSWRFSHKYPPTASQHKPPKYAVKRHFIRFTLAMHYLRIWRHIARGLPVDFDA